MTARIRRPGTGPRGAVNREISRYGLPLSKLRGLPGPARLTLKQRRITTCPQLLQAAARAEDRACLARDTCLDPKLLLQLAQRADMARVSGTGTVFGMMLEELEVADVATLAAQNPRELHNRLRRYNQQERIARRSPTAEEVLEWVEQARALPKLVSYELSQALPALDGDNWFAVGSEESAEPQMVLGKRLVPPDTDQPRS
jgi:predicted flap endonuclease-1-like 5' DNA nuclease